VAAVLSQDSATAACQGQASAADFQTQNFHGSFSQNSEPSRYTKISAASETLNRFVPVQLATVSKQPKLSARGSRTALDSGFEAWAPLFGGFPPPLWLFCSQAAWSMRTRRTVSLPVPTCRASFVRLPFSPSLASAPSPHFPCLLPVQLPLVSSGLLG